MSCADAWDSDGSELSAWGDEPDPDAASSELSDWEDQEASHAAAVVSQAGESSSRAAFVPIPCGVLVELLGWAVPM